MTPVLNWLDETDRDKVIECIISDFEITDARQLAAMRTEEFILHYAVYTYEDYSGGADVVFEYAGSLFEVHGSHCSYEGLEDQWCIEETSWEAIAMRTDELGEFATKLIKERNKKCQ